MKMMSVENGKQFEEPNMCMQPSEGKRARPSVSFAHDLQTLYS